PARSGRGPSPSLDCGINHRVRCAHAVLERFIKIEKREVLAMAEKAKGSSGPQRHRPSKADVSRGWTPRISRRVFFKGSAGAALALSGLSDFPASSKADSGTVVVMAWENYVDPEIQKRFHEATGITVRGVAADSDQDMFTKLTAGGGEQYDIVFANAGFCPLYHEAGLTEPLDLNQIPAAK